MIYDNAQILVTDILSFWDTDTLILILITDIDTDTDTLILISQIASFNLQYQHAINPDFANGLPSVYNIGML